MLPLNQISLGDCLDLLADVPDRSVDMILADLPYGTTACKWDSIIPLDELWTHYRRVTKPRAAIVLTAAQPFTTALIASNMAWFKYSWVWIKNRPTGMHHSKNRPLRKHEDVVVFSAAPMGHASLLGDRRMMYSPQGVESGPFVTVDARRDHGPLSGPRPNQIGRVYQSQSGFPTTILEFAKTEDHLHPTQKPVALFEYLVRTYTNPGDVVLDNVMGSGTTAIAALNAGRDFVGIERDPDYHRIACERIEQHRGKLVTQHRLPERGEGGGDCREA